MSATETFETIAAFAARLGITATVKRAESNPNMPESIHDRGARHFKVTLRRAGHRLTVPFTQGSAWATEPTVEDVLDCLATDASIVDNDELDEMGLTARQIIAVVRQTDKVRTFMGDEYEALLYETGRE